MDTKVILRVRRRPREITGSIRLCVSFQNWNANSFSRSIHDIESILNALCRALVMTVNHPKLTLMVSARLLDRLQGRWIAF
jgi:hypothetical protein